MEPKLILVEQAKRVSDREAQEAAKTESEKNQDGGYNAHPDVVDCFAAMKYISPQNEPVLFRLLTPEKTEYGRKYPLIVWLHGVGESGSDNQRQLAHVQLTMNFLAGKNKRDFFMIVPQCPKDMSWDDSHLTMIHDILEIAINEYPIDPDRIGVLGVCSGGSAAWDFVRKYPHRFASMAACSSSTTVPVETFQKTAVWAFNNKDDSPSYQSLEQLILAINLSGGNAFLTLQDHGGHDAWTTALRDENVLDWMLLQSLENGGPPAGVICYHRTGFQLFMMFGLPLFIMISVLIMLRRRSRNPHRKSGGQ
jgi:predicted peptidase